MLSMSIDNYLKPSFDRDSKNSETAEGTGTHTLYFRMGRPATSIMDTKGEVAT
jgi:hypothetical protein